MKRNAEASNFTFKKLRSSIEKAKPIPFPNVEKSFLDTDFSKWISHNDCDVWFSNGNVGFHTHKKILKVLSIPIKNMLEGDHEINVVEINEICDSTVELLRLLIEYEYRFARHIVWDERSRSSVRVVRDMLFLVGKFDIKIGIDLMERTNAQSAYGKFSVNEVLQIHNEANKFKIDGISKGINDYLRSRMIQLSTTSEDLEAYPKHMIREAMICHGSNMRHFGKFARYAINQQRNNGDKSFLQIIKDFSRPSNGWIAKIEFEKSQKDALLDILME